MSQLGFDYPKFLTAFKLYIFETITTLVVVALLLDFAVKELHPILQNIWQILHSP